MGLLRLLVHDRGRIEGVDLSRIFMMGFEELPWFGHVLYSDGQLSLQRAQDDSGSVCVPWQVAGRGEMLLATATLMERDEPYLLEVELARGMINRVRNQLGGWELLGLVVPADLREEVVAATRLFTRTLSYLDAPAEAARLAIEAIDAGVAVAERLASVYAQQAMQIRLAPQGRLTTLLGTDLGSGPPNPPIQEQIVSAFNLVSVPMSWRDVEASEGQRHWQESDAQIKWALAAGLKVMAGPLLEFDERRVPDWTYLWEGDYDSLNSFMLDHVRATVTRYKGKVHLWHVASRMNRTRVLSLQDEDRLQIVASAVRMVKQLDPRTPIVVSVDQPFAEYMSTRQIDLAPIHYADALVRADIGISGLGLELNIGHQPRATAPRTPLAFSRLLDQWSLFELPLVVMLTAGTTTTKEINDQAAEPTDAASSLFRAEWIERYLPVILAKNCVQVVVWNQLYDREAEFPHAGLFDEAGEPKPALKALASIRKDFLT